MFLDPAIPDEVRGDALRLRQVLVNLANNAIKFSSGRQEPGRVSVRAVLVDRSLDQVTVEFQIIDNGIGMRRGNPGTAVYLLYPGRCLHHRRFGGTGLGLAISHHLVN